MLLMLAFAVGVLLIVFAVMFLFFPDKLDDLSNTMGQVVMNIEMGITKLRVPAGVGMFALGVWLIWLSLNYKS